jgi:DNA processing protein
MMTQTEIDAAERLDRLRLIRSENVGPITFRQLILRYGTAAAALEALPRLAQRGGRGRRLRIASKAEAERELDALHRAGGTMLHWGQPDYPTPLAVTDDAPPVLSVLGHPHLLCRTVIAIVGSRNASTNGKRMAGGFAQALGEAGFVVASGLASGIDTAAHRGSLNSGTIAVVAGGADVIYPKENTELHAEIAARGAIAAELPMGTIGQARHFPRRNRIISGLARAVLVVEATQRSGSLITARLAADQGRDVYAVPGSPLDPRARGANDLIRKGAALVETPEELIRLLEETPAPSLDTPPERDFIPAPVQAEDADVLAAARKALTRALSPTPVSLDDLIEDLGLTPAVLATVLLEMELAGLIERHAGGRVSRLAPDLSAEPEGPARLREPQGDLF